MAVDLNGVSGTSASDVLLVGDGALILRGANISWTRETAPISAAIPPSAHGPQHRLRAGSPAALRCAARPSRKLLAAA